MKTDQQYHKGALYDIPHPGADLAACPYCTDTLRQVGIDTLAAAYAAGVAAERESRSDTPLAQHG